MAGIDVTELAKIAITVGNATVTIPLVIPKTLGDTTVLQLAVLTLSVLFVTGIGVLGFFKIIIFSLVPWGYSVLRRLGGYDDGGEDDTDTTTQKPPQPQTSAPTHTAPSAVLASDSDDSDSDNSPTNSGSEKSDTSTTSLNQHARHLALPPPHPYRLISIFEQLHDLLFDAVCREVKEKTLGYGEVLFREGDCDNSVYVVIAGRIRMTCRSTIYDSSAEQNGRSELHNENNNTNKDVVVSVVSRGGCVAGWLSAFSDLPHQTTATSIVANTRVLQLTQESVIGLVHAHPIHMCKALSLTMMRFGRVLFVALHKHLGLPVLAASHHTPPRTLAFMDDVRPLHKAQQIFIQHICGCTETSVPNTPPALASTAGNEFNADTDANKATNSTSGKNANVSAPNVQQLLHLLSELQQSHTTAIDIRHFNPGDVVVLPPQLSQKTTKNTAQGEVGEENPRRTTESDFSLPSIAEISPAASFYVVVEGEVELFSVLEENDLAAHTYQNGWGSRSSGVADVAVAQAEKTRPSHRVEKTILQSNIHSASLENLKQFKPPTRPQRPHPIAIGRTTPTKQQPQSSAVFAQPPPRTQNQPHHHQHHHQPRQQQRAYEIFARRNHKRCTLERVCRQNDAFGHMGVLTLEQDGIGCIASRKTTLAIIPRATVMHVIEHNFYNLRGFISHFLHMLHPSVVQLESGLQWKTIEAGHVVEGEPRGIEGGKLFVVLSGRVRETRQIKEGESDFADDNDYDDENEFRGGKFMGSGVRSFVRRWVARVQGKREEEDAKLLQEKMLQQQMQQSQHKKQREIVLRELSKGEIAGDLGLLPHATNTQKTTLRAMRDTEVAVISQTLFRHVARSFPELLFRLGAQLSAKLEQSSQLSVARIPESIPFSSSNSNHNPRSIITIAILPVSQRVDTSVFCAGFLRALNRVGPTLHLSSEFVEQRLGSEVFSTLGMWKWNNQVIRWLREQEDRHRYILYEADAEATPWSECCVRSADYVLLVGNSDDMPDKSGFRKQTAEVIQKARTRISSLMQQNENALRQRQAQNSKTQPNIASNAPSAPDPSWPSFVETKLLAKVPHVTKALVVLYASPNTTKPRGARKWLKRRKYVERLFNIKMHSEQHLQRLARLVTGTGIGVVLGGGGARGIAHIGVLRALQDADIPIDVIGGTSIGALMSCLFATEDGDMKFVQAKAKSVANALASNWTRILDLTFPITSFFSGAGFNTQIRSAISPETRIEDLWIPFFCVTTNLSRSKLGIHQRGFAWKYVRASMTLTGYLPPICDGSDMLVDGGYMNNLPSDVMRSLGLASTIISVDVASADDFATRYTPHGKTLSGWWALWHSIRPFSTVRIPSMGAIAEQLSYVTCVRHMEIAKACSDVYLRPHVEHYGTLAFGQFKEIHDAGYNYTVESMHGKSGQHQISDANNKNKDSNDSRERRGSAASEQSVSSAS